MLSQKLFYFWPKFLEHLSKLHFPSSEEGFEVLFELFIFLFVSFGFYPQKTIQRLAENFQKASQKKQSGCPGDHFEEKEFLKKIYILPDRFYTSRQFFEEFSEIFSA